MVHIEHETLHEVACVEQASRLRRCAGRIRKARRDPPAVGVDAIKWGKRAVRKKRRASGRVDGCERAGSIYSTLKRCFSEISARDRRRENRRARQGK